MFARIKSFLLGVKSELKRVSWPTKEQAIRSSAVVLIMVAIMTIFLAIVNTIFVQLIKLIIN